MDSKNDMYSPKCFCGMSVVKACFVFAIVNASVVSLMIIGCLVSLVLVTARYAAGYIMNSNQLFGLVAMVLITVAFYVATIISAIFATMLIIGIRKKKPNFLKAYLVFGIVVEVALIFGTFVYIGIQSQSHQGLVFFAVFGTAAVCVCILYGFMVQLVYITYVFLKNSQSTIADVQTLCLAEMEGPHFEVAMPT